MTEKTQFFEKLAKKKKKMLDRMIYICYYK